MTTINLTTLTIGSGSNRALVVQIAFSGTVTNLGMRWDETGTPQAMTAITGASATNTVLVQLWGLVAPTSGNKTLKVGNGSGGSWTTATDVCVNGVSWTGVDQTGGATSFPHGVGATGNSDGATDASLSVTSAVNNAVMATWAVPATAINAVLVGTQTFRDNTPANMSAAGTRAAGAASATMTIDCNASGQAYAVAGTDIAIAAAGGTTATDVSTLFLQRVRARRPPRSGRRIV